MPWSWDLHGQNKLVSKRLESSRGQGQGPRTQRHLQCPTEILQADTRESEPSEAVCEQGALGRLDGPIVWF